MDLVTALLLFAVFVILFIASRLRSKYPSLPGPGLREYLPNGDVFNIMKDSRTFSRSFLSLWKKYGDVFQIHFGPADSVVTSVPADIVQILSSNTFARPPAMRYLLNDLVPDSLFSMAPQVHLAARRSLRENFNYALLKGIHSHIIEATRELCDSLTAEVEKTDVGRPSELLDMSKKLAVTTFRIITNAAFGYDMSKEDRQKFADNTDELVEEMLKDITGYPLRQAMAFLGTRKRLRHYKEVINAFCQRFVDQRLQESEEDKAKRPADILDAIVEASDHEKSNILSQTVLFAVAGSHTTYEATIWAIYEIYRNPQVLQKIQEELKIVVGERTIDEYLTFEDVDKLTYLQQVWKESLRIHPVSVFILRETTKDVVLSGSGLQLPRGSLVFAFLLGGQMNPSIWSQPEQFDPERWAPLTGEHSRVPPGAFVPFSIGPRNCAGRFLADYEAVLILAELCRRFEINVACNPNEIMSATGWIEGLKSNVDGSDFEFGLPVHVSLRS